MNVWLAKLYQVGFNVLTRLLVFLLCYVRPLRLRALHNPPCACARWPSRREPSRCQGMLRRRLWPKRVSRRVSEDDLILLRWASIWHRNGLCRGLETIDPACSGDVERVSAGVSTSWFRDQYGRGRSARDKTTVRLRVRPPCTGDRRGCVYTVDM
jgi:hypothetical protein